MTVITYEIREGRNAPCELWSVATNIKFGSTAENFVCEGTHNYCQSIKIKLEAYA
jgi:hypothetical protein